MPAKPSFISEFEIIGVEAQHAPSYAPDLDPKYAVKGLLNIGEVSVLYGAPGLGKTAITAATCAHVATGKDFADCLTQKSCVIYFAAEDGPGVHKRAYPYLSTPAFSGAPFYVVPAGFDLTNSTTVSKVINFVKTVMAAHELDQALIVFDTLNRMLGVCDENSSTVIGSVLASAGRIAAETNAAVLMIHHTGKGNSSTPRGSSAIEGNADNLYYLARSKEDDKLVFWKPQKTKSAAEAKALAFRIGSHPVGRDKDGVEVSFPKAVPQGATGFTKTESANDNRKPKVDTNSRIEEVSQILIEERRVNPTRTLKSPEIAERTGTAFRDVKDNRDSLLKAVKRALHTLVADGKVEKKDDSFRLIKTLIIDHDDLRA
ncbi:AAA family ATPase [Sulfitobacter guttiformis]|uniref:AAA domain-containing protein n=1 Tax=Sulfitobacter guttiformis TaxID=74349 RepID=A0A420DQ00_9RHOB|nr:AAA family ATPase [Sulfitobacter guttiformis]KIN73561.1 AAA ATPase [Sulfitobacter guttiformis KCTC 32187]RKE96207.1 AAA domain-containing protein [Sulfitobacter guttiformis]